MTLHVNVVNIKGRGTHVIARRGAEGFEKNFMKTKVACRFVGTRAAIVLIVSLLTLTLSPG